MNISSVNSVGFKGQYKIELNSKEAPLELLETIQDLAKVSTSIMSSSSQMICLDEDDRDFERTLQPFQKKTDINIWKKMGSPAPQPEKEKFKLPWKK